MDADTDPRLRFLDGQRPGLAAFTQRMIVALESLRRDFDASARGLQAERPAGRTVPPEEAARRAEAALAELAAGHEALVAGLWDRVLRQAPGAGATRH